MRIALLDDYQDAALQLADWSRLPPGTVVERFSDHLSDEDDVGERLLPFDVVVAMRERTPFSLSLLGRLVNLRLLITTGAWNAAIDVLAAVEQGVVVCGTRGLGWPTAELTWGLVLALARQIPAESNAIAGGRWQTTLGVGLRGKTLGVVGLGKLGSEVARFGHAFGMDVLGWSQNLTAERAAEVGVTFVTKDELLARSDFLSIHLVLGGRTRGIIGAHELSQMKPTAYLVNTSRGPIVDELALSAALASGQLAGAAVDVFDVEPLSVDHPFRALKNLIMTPHIGYVTKETYEIFYGDALEDILAWGAGSPVRVITA
jgi:phosphoglycerate dehydrogenase-like enzyme